MPLRLFDKVNVLHCWEFSGNQFDFQPCVLGATELSFLKFTLSRWLSFEPCVILQ